jgi:hypothetical protein
MLTAQTRFRQGRRSRISPQADHLISLAQVAHRWDTTPECARRRLEQLGTTIVRFNRNSCQVWLSDLLAIEKRFSSTSREQLEGHPD